MCKTELVGTCGTAHGAQLRALSRLRWVGWGRGMCVHIADSLRVQQKPTQHCKATMPQLKIFLKKNLCQEATFKLGPEGRKGISVRKGWE